MFRGPFSVTGEETSYIQWFLFAAATSLVAFPVFFVASLLKMRKEAPITVPDLRHAFGIAAQALLPSLFMTSVGGFLVVGVGTVAVSWALKLGGLPDEYFNIAAHPTTFYGPLFGLYALWWFFCVVLIVRWLPRSRREAFINL